MDSEKSYLRRIKRELNQMIEEKLENENISDIENKITILHPRYSLLNEKYDNELLPMVEGDMKTNNTINDELTLVTMNNIIIGGGINMKSEPIIKKLPSTIQISKLKQMIKALFQIDLPIHLISLSFRMYKDNISPPQLMDDDSCTLGYYGVTSDGGDIFINALADK